MVEDINVCEDRKGYCLVDLVSGYLLVHFFLSKDGESMEKLEGGTVWGSVRAGRKICTRK